MGTLIPKTGPTSIIFMHLDTSWKRSLIREGKIGALAAETLGEVHASSMQVVADLDAAKEAEATFTMELTVTREKTNAVVKRLHDELWNDIGRPQIDAAFSILFPGGSGVYTEGKVEKQPRRMEVLARLFDKKLHPKLTPEQHAAAAATLRAAGQQLAAVVEAGSIPQANVELLEQTLTAMARAAQMALVNFKRALKNAGLTETQIHAVIPEHQRPSAKRGAPKGEPKATKGEPKVAVSEPKVAVSEPKVAVSEPKVAVSEPKVAVSEPKVAAAVEASAP